MLSINGFQEVELKVGTVLEAEDVEGSEKLIKLKVDLGPKKILKQVQDDERDVRQILAGVKQWYKPKDFIGKQVVIVANLEPRIMMGFKSRLRVQFPKAMLL